MKMMHVRSHAILGICSILFLAPSPPRDTKAGEQWLINIRYRFLSQRWLTDRELTQFKDVSGIVLAVRLRLSNESTQHLLYLATSGTVVPTGYHLFRPVEARDWRSTSPGRGREGPPGSEFTGVAYSWLELPPGGAVEVEAHDWSKPSEEHAFSTFIKIAPDAIPIEIISEGYRPLVKKGS